jgi:hypothetical protein
VARTSRECCLDSSDVSVGGGGVGLVWWEGEGKGKGWRRGEVRTGVGEVGFVAAGGVGDVFGGGTFHCIGAGVGRCSGVSWFGFQCLRDGLGGKVLMVGGWLPYGGTAGGRVQ